MQENDFSGQDLRGRSFKNKELENAIFSDCDLRGVDFSGANLTAAKFYRAKTGRSLKLSCSISAVQVPLAIIAVSIVFAGNMFLAKYIKKILVSLTIYSDENLTIVMVIYTLMFTGVIFAAINRNRFAYLYWFFWLIIAGSLPLSFAEIEGARYLFFAAVIAGALTGIGSIVASVAVTNTNTETEVIASTCSAVIAISLFLGAREDLHLILAETVGMAITVPCIIFIFLQVYLGNRAIEKEEPQLHYLRQWILNFNCLGGTKFEFATLKEADFSQADLRYARFKNAKIIGCHFQQAKNHHLALTDGTPLETRKVRDLVIGGIITEKNFAALDLRGLDFSELDLQGFDFSHANLSGANLSQTQMTGATLEGWNIDTETVLDDIDCRYYYYLENGKKKRMPPAGEEYKTGEFTRIFQKIANTIDFIAHNEMELAAIKLSVEQVKVESGNDDVRVQAIEEKGGFIVVKVTVPKTEDRGVLYHEVNSLKQEYEAKIQIMSAENRAQITGYEARITDLKEELDKKRNALTIIIENSTINNNGVMNLGEINGNISQH